MTNKPTKKLPIRSARHALRKKPFFLASFGVGCFHFEDIAEDTFSERASYEVRLRQLLESLSNVSDLKIEGFGSTKYLFGYEEDETSTDIADSVGVQPWPSNAEISFKIFLPKRVHNEFSGNWDATLEAETLEIRIIYGNSMPVTIVRGIDKLLHSPSTSIFVVRKHLEENLKKSTDQGIEFRSL